MSIQQAQKDKTMLTNKYNVSISSIVWTGNRKYIIVINGKEIKEDLK